MSCFSRRPRRTHSMIRTIPSTTAALATAIPVIAMSLSPWGVSEDAPLAGADVMRSCELVLLGTKSLGVELTLMVTYEMVVVDSTLEDAECVVGEDDLGGEDGSEVAGDDIHDERWVEEAARRSVVIVYAEG